MKSKYIKSQCGKDWSNFFSTFNRPQISILSKSQEAHNNRRWTYWHLVISSQQFRSRYMMKLDFENVLFFPVAAFWECPGEGGEVATLKKPFHLFVLVQTFHLFILFQIFIFLSSSTFSSFYPRPTFHLFILAQLFIFLSSPNPYDVPLKWLFHPRTLVPLPVLLWCKQDVLVFWTNQSLQAFIPLSPFLRVPHGIRSLLMLLNYWRTSDLWQAKFVTTKWQGTISAPGGGERGGRGYYPSRSPKYHISFTDILYLSIPLTVSCYL